jgi:hypothetical protein
MLSRFALYILRFTILNLPSSKFAMSLTIDRKYLIETLTNLIRINSINPKLMPDGAGEAEIAAYIASAATATS